MNGTVIENGHDIKRSKALLWINCALRSFLFLSFILRISRKEGCKLYVSITFPIRQPQNYIFFPWTDQMTTKCVEMQKGNKESKA